MFKSKVPEGGHNGVIYLHTSTWFEARDICRRTYQDEVHEPLWREMDRLEPDALVPGDFVYWKDLEQREVRHGIVKKAGVIPTDAESEVEPISSPKKLLRKRVMPPKTSRKKRQKGK
jgi:hypothetical protein